MYINLLALTEQEWVMNKGWKDLQKGYIMKMVLPTVICREFSICLRGAFLLLIVIQECRVC